MTLVGRRGGLRLLYGGALLLAFAFGAVVAYAQKFGGDNGPYLVVGALLAIVVAAAILLQWRLGVLMLLATLPYLAVINVGSIASGTKGLTLLTLISLALALPGDEELAERFKRFWQQPLTLLVSAFVLWSFTSILWASDQGAAIVKTVTFLGVFALMMLVGMLEAKYLGYLWGITVLSAALSIPAGYLLPQSGQMAEYGRFGTGGADPNAFAAALVTTFLVFYFGLSRQRTLVYFLAPVLLYGIFATQSRTGLIAVICAPLLAAVIPRLRLRMGARALLLYSLGAVAFVAIALLVPSLGAALSGRYETLTQYQDADTWSGRWSIWQGAFHVIVSHPILGVGAGNFGEAAVNYSTTVFQAISEGKPGVAHNMFLSITSELGIVGVALFLGILFFGFKTVLQLCRRSTLSVGLFLGLVAYVTAGMSLTAETDKLAYVIYGSILSLQLQQEPQRPQEDDSRDAF